MKKLLGLAGLRTILFLAVAVSAVLCSKPMDSYADRYYETYEEIGNTEKVNETDTYLLSSGGGYCYLGDGLNITYYHYNNETGLTQKYLTDTSGHKLIHSFDSDTPKSYGIKFEYAGKEDTYYIKEAGGKYLHSHLTKGEYRIELVANKADATKWTIDYKDGEIYESNGWLFDVYLDTQTGGGYIDSESVWGASCVMQIMKKVPTNAISKLTMTVNVNGKDFETVLQEDNKNAWRNYNVVTVAAPCYLNDLGENTQISFTATPASAGSTAVCNTITIGDIRHRFKCLEVTIKTPGLPDAKQYYELVIEGHKEWYTEKTIKEATCVSGAETALYCSGYNKFIDHDKFGESEKVSTECIHYIRKGSTGQPDPNAHENTSYYLAPTCASYGYYRVVECKLCGLTSKFGRLQKTNNHNYVQTEVVDPGNCQTEKTVKLECTLCHTTITETAGFGEHISADNEEVKATCISEGRTAGTYCSVCGKILSGNEVIPKTDHKWNDGLKLPAEGCGGAITAHYLCEIPGCGARKSEIVGMEGHTFVDVAEVPASCTESGVSAYQKCSKCEAEFGKTVIPALGHTPETLEGYPATCDKTGLSEGTKCSVCDAVLTEQEVIPVLDHLYDLGTQTKEPTCVESGTILYKCTREGCSHSYSDTIEASGHTETSCSDVAPTCEAAGSRNGKYCLACGTILEAPEVIEALGHEYDNGVEVQAMSCERDRVVLFTCTRQNCNHSYTSKESALGHAFTSAVTKDPSCTTIGERTYTCTNNGCNASFKESISPLGHSYDNGVEVQALSCEHNRITRFTCSGCKDSYTVEENATGHSITSSVTKEAGCETAGTRTYRCTNNGCGLSYTEEIPAIGHKYDDGVVTKEPTVDEAGIRTYTCQNDNSHKYTVSIAKLPAAEQPGRQTETPANETPANETPANEAQNQNPQTETQTPVVEPAAEPVPATAKADENAEANADEGENTEVIANEGENAEITPVAEIVDDEVAKTATVEDEAVPAAAATVTHQSFIWLFILLAVIILTASAYLYYRYRKAADKTE